MDGEVVKDTKIAVISDVHGNYQALLAVMNDIQKKGISYIICLGDIIGKGVNSRKCIDLIRSKCNVVLMGNVDDRFCDDPEKFRDDAEEYQRIKYYQSLLTKEDIDFFHNLPLFTEFYLSGNLVRLFHSSMNDPYPTLTNYELDFRKKYDLFCPDNVHSKEVADIVVYGHIHYHFLEKIYGKTLMNCGSVGCSGCAVLEDGYNSMKEISNAHYLVLQGNLNDRENAPIGFQFESIPYDKETEIEDSDRFHNVYSGYRELLEKGHYPDLDDIMKKFSEDGYQIFHQNEN
ncbi:MAG: metallophosphoesterase family protein [Bacilli bacterium]|nr:metallophosphoesterase family protein [Bacilli bacterium]